MDILYLGINMGNCLGNRRFFCRYPQAEQDYYEGFKWLTQLKRDQPTMDICIKHHGGDYVPARDKREMCITADTGIKYIDSQLDSYKLALQAEVCVSYCSTMILELNGHSNMAKYLWERRHKHVLLNKPCKGYANPCHYEMPAYYLDPGHRNRQFCRHIDDVHRHDCAACSEPPYLEIFEPYRLTDYKQFKATMLKEVSSDDDRYQGC